MKNDKRFLRLFFPFVILGLAGFIALPLSLAAAESGPVDKSVYAMKYADDFPMPMYSAFYAGPRYYPKEESPPTAMFYWLIKADSHNILVDAGMSPEAAAGFKFPNYVSPDVLLGKVGLKPSDIDSIIVTHGHFDHIEGVHQFKNAKIFAQRETYRFMVETGPEFTFFRQRGYPQKTDSLMVLNLMWDGRLKLVDGNAELFPGIRVIRVDGHMPGLQIVVVETKDNPIVLTSDALVLYLNLERDHPMGGVNGSQVDILKGFEIIRQLKGTVVPGHDASVLDRFKKIESNVVQIY